VGTVFAVATVSSTRPPAPGEASSTPEGEASSEAPIAGWDAVGQQEPWQMEPPAETPPPVPAAPAEPVPPTVRSTYARVDFPALASMVLATRPPVAEALPEEEDSSTSVIVDPAQLTVLSSTVPLPGVTTPPPGMPLPVLLLVDQARSASGAEQQQLSRRINRWLEQMAREGGSRHVADWFHHLLDSSRLEGLSDEAGQGCHETAVKGLMAMGFPYALEIAPEDLERLRPREGQRGHKKRARRLEGAAAGVLVGGISAEVLLNMLSHHPMGTLLTTEVGLALLALVAALVSRERTPLRNMGLAVLLVVSAFSLGLGIISSSGGLVAGLAGLVATLLLALHRS
jgi:hypothetical protein